MNGKTSTITLPYCRISANEGSDLTESVHRDHQLFDALSSETCVIEFRPQSPRLGDRVLFIAAAKALSDFRTLKCLSSPTFVLSEHLKIVLGDFLLFRGASTVAANDAGAHIVLCDGPIDQVVSGYLYMITRDETPRVVEQRQSDGGTTHFSLPARTYLKVERDLGTLLKCCPNFYRTEAIFADDTGMEEYWANLGLTLNAGRDPLICCIATTAREDIKQFGVDRFIGATEAILANLGISAAQVALIVGWDCDCSQFEDVLRGHRSSYPHIPIICSNHFGLTSLGYLFARCHLCLSNDTGLAHVAALSVETEESESPEVLVLYSRHDHAKWNTGGTNVYSLFTKFSAYLHATGLSAFASTVDWQYWKGADDARLIPVDDVVALGGQLFLQALLKRSKGKINTGHYE